MNFKLWTILFWLCVFSVENAFSQNSAPILLDNTNSEQSAYKAGEVRGNIKRKAVLLPLPPFPREAFEAGADGIVKVEIQIDADGSVVAAKAISGNPLLFAAAEETARRTKFRRVETTEQDFKETGFLNYTFVIEKASWLKIGYDLAIIQKIPTLSYFNVPRTAKAFAPEWTGEIEMLGKLAEMRRVEMQTESTIPIPGKPVLVRVTTPNTAAQVGRAEIRSPPSEIPSGERIALSQNLTAALQSRLASSNSDLWRFNLGVNLAKSLELFRARNDGSTAAQVLRESAATAPPDFPAESLTALQNLIQIFELGRRKLETPDEIRKAVTIIFKDK